MNRKQQPPLIIVHHDAEEIHHILERVKKDGEHHWWETLFEWSPTATRTLNLMLHPIVVLLALVILCLLLNIVLYIKVWRITKQVTLLQEPPCVYNVV